MSPLWGRQVHAQQPLAVQVHEQRVWKVLVSGVMADFTTKHLPECKALDEMPEATKIFYRTSRQWFWEHGCICDHLRACEQRVRQEIDRESFALDEGDPYREAYRAGLDAAETAVNEVLDRTPNAMNGEYITVSKHFPADLIDAIRALKEKP